MPENSWPENDFYKQSESLELPLPDFSLSDEEDDSTGSYRGYEGRRRKAAVLLTVIWSGTIALHLFSWGIWFVLGATALMGIHAVRILSARPIASPEPLFETDIEQYPFVSLMVAAKNEEAVIAQLVKMLCNLDYPSDRYEVWVIDDYSTDRTPVLLEKLARQYDRLQVFHRSATATGGKSGALNQVLPLTQGEILAVFDADAQVTPDLLQRVIPRFHRSQVGAVQLRKAIANASVNFWTRGQMAEMALDSYFQQQRTAIGGIGELRGNGQFVRRKAIERCGGWNEETITDDLDLTIRLHLDDWDIEFALEPAVQEEGVTRPVALWHQRNRWAEGGYQRYLDYWRLIVRNRMGWRKTWDLFMFWIIQYFLPNAAVPDCLMAIARSKLPVYSPVTALMLLMSVAGMFGGLRRIQHAHPHPQSIFTTFIQTVRGTLYMFHWLLIVATTSARISVRPKRLKWVKTLHQGSGEESFEF